MTSLEKLIAHLTAREVLEDPVVAEAFREVDRADFILPEYASTAYFDGPLPIGFGQTISQPFTVAFMLGLLNVLPGQAVLDIGSGSGWTTALLARITGPDGTVLGLERCPELVEFGSSNLRQYTFPWARITRAGTTLGDPGAAYDRILVSAAAPCFPEELIKQLNPGGRLVIPVNHSIWQFNRTGRGIEKEEFYGFSFVPLIWE